MPLQLTEVQNVEDFKEVVIVEHKAYASPYDAFWEILKGPSIEECTQREWMWHTSTPGSCWLKVTDGDQVVGGVEWIIHEKNPFENPQPIIKGDWWPEGNSSGSLNREIRELR